MPSTCVIFRRSLHPRCTRALARGPRQGSHASALLIHDIFVIKTAPLRGAGSGAPRAWLWPWRGPARRARAVPSHGAALSRYGQSGWLGAVASTPVLLAFDCPAPGRRVQGAPCGRVACDRLAPTPDPPSARTEMAPISRTGANQATSNPVGWLVQPVRSPSRQSEQLPKSNSKCLPLGLMCSMTFTIPKTPPVAVRMTNLSVLVNAIGSLASGSRALPPNQVAPLTE